MFNINAAVKMMELAPRTICEVGVNKPEISQLKEIIKHHNFRKAILIEPQPDIAHELADAYEDDERVFVYGCAVTDKIGEVTMQLDGESTYIDGLPWSPSMALNGVIPRPTIKVPGCLFTSFDNGEIDVLAVDTEGSEWFVIKNMVSRPKLIVMETHLLFHAYKNPYMTEINHWMDINGYTKLCEMQSDTAWVKC